MNKGPAAGACGGLSRAGRRALRAPTRTRPRQRVGLSSAARMPARRPWRRGGAHCARSDPLAAPHCAAFNKYFVRDGAFLAAAPTRCLWRRSAAAGGDSGLCSKVRARPSGGQAGGSARAALGKAPLKMRQRLWAGQALPCGRGTRGVQVGQTGDVGAGCDVRVPL